MAPPSVSKAPAPLADLAGADGAPPSVTVLPTIARTVTRQPALAAIEEGREPLEALYRRVRPSYPPPLP